MLNLMEGFGRSSCSMSDGAPAAAGDMARPSRSVDYWRKFFRCASADIFEVVENAILVAATDCPEEFRSRREGISEKLYTALLRPQGVEMGEKRSSARRGAIEEEEGHNVVEIARGQTEDEEMEKSKEKEKEKKEMEEKEKEKVREKEKKKVEEKEKAEKANKPQKQPLTVIHDRSANYADESWIKAKLEITKRKLHEGYQRAENAKKQRTIKIMELSEIPKKVHIRQSTLKIKIPPKLRCSG